MGSVARFGGSRGRVFKGVAFDSKTKGRGQSSKLQRPNPPHLLSLRPEPMTQSGENGLLK